MDKEERFGREWMKQKKEATPQKPEYAFCNQGHNLLLVENDRGEMTWDCPTCIRKMKVEIADVQTHETLTGEEYPSEVKE